MPTKRKAWETLTPPYRRRLERAGIDQIEYESGTSLTRARGHSATPEHPIRAERDASRYAGYIKARVKQMRVATSNGVQLVVIPSKAERSRVGTYDNAVKNLLSGNSSTENSKRELLSLVDFDGARVHGFVGASNELQELNLLTDERQITARYYTGELRYEQIYAHVN